MGDGGKVESLDEEITCDRGDKGIRIQRSCTSVGANLQSSNVAGMMYERSDQSSERLF